MMQFVLLYLLRALAAFLNVLPLGLRIRFISLLIRGVTFLMPRFRRTALQNLKIAFGSESQSFRAAILDRSYAELARVFVDFVRLPVLDRAWVDAHVSCPFFPRLLELKRQNPGKGVLIATGHLGSFELLAHYTAAQGNPISFVVRDFKLPIVDKWWKGIREANGNKVISRKGAFKHILADISAGKDVGILFDQNVTKKHAVFVDWFGVPAATTRAVALTAIRTEAPVVVASIVHEEGDRYRIEVKECDFRAIYADSTLEPEQKVKLITERCSQLYQEMILLKPEGWFWMHRRWKTRPDAESPSIY